MTGSAPRISGQPKTGVKRRRNGTSQGSIPGERKSGQFAFGSWPVLRDRENLAESRCDDLLRRVRTGVRPEMPALLQRGAGGDG